MTAMAVDENGSAPSALKRPGTSNSSRRVSLAPADTQGLHPGVIHIGMVREGCLYEATIPLAHSLGPNVTFDFEPHPQFFVQSSQLVPSPEGHVLQLTFKSDVKGEHTLTVHVRSSTAATKFTIGCAFMPSEFGKPALNDNVRLISVPLGSRPGSASGILHHTE